MKPKQHTIKRILVANRGEIACRIIRSIHRLGLTAVAMYSEVDSDAPHVHEADEAYFLGASESAQSYLNMEKIISAALAAQIDAIHPGYGFLSENAEFAQKVLDAGIIWIGPSPEAIALMGEKAQAKEQARLAGVPVLDGVKIDQAASEPERLALIRETGFPLLIKATYGGGGRGIRLVEREEDFETALQTAQSEAKNAFGSPEVMIEKYVQGARHIELQVLADQHGNRVHLFERECSVQRRRQKVIEEAPASMLSKKTRRKMSKTALKLVKQIGYVSAGTIEFLVDSEENFYFLEMNTRLQVEHTVTEEITSLDLVEWQIRIAQGEKLALSQDLISIWGHSIQARLYAEDPYREFLPQSGSILQYVLEDFEGVRYDHGLHEADGAEPQKQEISAYYDPMIAKIISHGETREIAIDRLEKALRSLRCFGITTNQAYLQQILHHEDFQTGSIDIHWLEKQTWQRKEPNATALAIASLLLAFRDRLVVVSQGVFFSRGHVFLEQKIRLIRDEQKQDYIANIRPKMDDMYRNISGKFDVSLNGDEVISLEIIAISATHLCAVCNGIRFEMHYHFSEEGLWLLYQGESYFLQVPNPFVSTEKEENSLDISASMLGKVVSMPAKIGDRIRKGDVICIIEAMKMEHQMSAKADGILQELFISVGNQVKAGQLLGRLAEAE